jgi:hypothetical protein
MAHDTLIIRLAALSCTSRCVIFALLHLLLRFQLERLRVWSVAGWLAGRRTGGNAGGGWGRKGEWHGCISKKQKKKKLGVGAKLQRNTV